MSANIMGGDAALSGRIAVLQLGLKVAMDQVVRNDGHEGYSSSMDSAKHGAVVKLSGESIHDPDASNVGKSIIVPKDSQYADAYKGVPLNSLKQKDLATLSRFNPGKIEQIDGVWKFSDQTEGGTFMQGVGTHLPGANAFANFRDVWMNDWGVSSDSFFGSLFLKSSIAIAAYAQYQALGGWTQERILHQGLQK